MRSLSPSFRESHATCRGAVLARPTAAAEGRMTPPLQWIHSLRSVVLPKPAGAEEGQLAVQASVQPLDQARTRHQFGPGGGDIEFGLQERCGHFILCVAE